MKTLLFALFLSAFTLSTAIASDSSISTSAGAPRLHLVKSKKSHKHHSHKQQHHSQHKKPSRAQSVTIPVEPSVPAGQFYQV